MYSGVVPTSFEKFGSRDELLYRRYLEVFFSSLRHVCLSEVGNARDGGCDASAGVASGRMLGFVDKLDEGGGGDFWGSHLFTEREGCRCYDGRSYGARVFKDGEGGGASGSDVQGRVSRYSDGVCIGEAAAEVSGFEARELRVDEVDVDRRREEDGCSGFGSEPEVGSDVGNGEGQQTNRVCGVGVVRGKNWKKNQRKRENRKSRINVDTGSGVDSCSGLAQACEINVDTGSQKFEQGAAVFSGKPKSALRLSLERKWALENELKALRAEREIELLKAEDREAVKKLRERKVQGATERTMVQIEKAHASLVQTGNVPGAQLGFCQTVVDGEIVESVPGLSSGESKECSISPSSSISEREVRNMMKELEDLREENRKYRRKEGLEERVGRMYSESVPVTLDSEECVPEDIKELAADRFEGPEFFSYGKVFEKDNKKYRTMRFDAEGYSYSGRENWYG